jgi:hypothetical protein
MKEETLLKLINIVRNLREDGGMVTSSIANNASSGKIAGLPPDNPPVFKNKKTDSREKNRNPFFEKLPQIERRNPPQ